MISIIRNNSLKLLRNYNNGIVKRLKHSNTNSKNNFDDKQKFYATLSIASSSLLCYSLYNKINKEEKKVISLNELKDEYKNRINKVTILDDEIAVCTLDNDEIINVTIPKSEIFEKKMDPYQFPVYYKKTIGFSSLLSVGLSLGMFGLFFMIMRRQMNGFNNMMGKASDIFVDTNIKTKFKDIIGQDNARRGVKEFVGILKNREKYKKIGVKVPKGALLYGPPGTGKTLLAKAIAGESELPFVNMSGSDFNAMFVGVGSAKVKNLYNQAKIAAEEHGGCIVFIDEIDAIGQKRSSANTFGGNSERENTLNQLLTEMDGFDSNNNIMTFGATNRPELLDPALLRPGRFDRKITVDIPTIKEREQLFSFYLDKLNIDDKIIPPISHLGSKLTPGFSGADIANICNEAGILAVRKERDYLINQDIKDAIDYVMLGAERENILTEKDKNIVAYHEAGHAILSCLLPNVTNPVKVSIMPREKGMLGFSQSEISTEVLQSKNQILDSICVLMGGRISEEINCQDITTGASNDIEKATDLANNYVKKFGMQDHIFMNLTDNNQFKTDISDELRNKVDAKVLELIEGLYTKTHNILLNNQEKIEKVKDLLLEKETIYYSDLETIVN